jgi:predicted transcriptional regulator
MVVSKCFSDSRERSTCCGLAVLEGNDEVRDDTLVGPDGLRAPEAVIAEDDDGDLQTPGAVDELDRGSYFLDIVNLQT